MVNGRPRGRRQGGWTPEEDAILKDFMEKNANTESWTTLPGRAGLRRCGKSCRLRWVNYLKPGINHGSFTEEEEKKIIDWHRTVGTRWSTIAEQLPGRTDNDIKNYWNSQLKKRLAKKGKSSPLGDQRADVKMLHPGHLSQDTMMQRTQHFEQSQQLEEAQRVNEWVSNIIVDPSDNGMHHQSPTLDCSNGKSDDLFGGQIDEAPYEDPGCYVPPHIAPFLKQLEFDFKEQLYM